MPKVKHSIEKTREIVGSIEKRVNEGYSITQACKQENITRQWYYTALKRLDEKENDNSIKSKTDYFYKEIKQFVTKYERNSKLYNEKNSLFYYEDFIKFVLSRYLKDRLDLTDNNEFIKKPIPDRIFVPISDVNYLYIEQFAKERGMSVSQFAAFLLSDKIEQYRSEQRILSEDKIYKIFQEAAELCLNK